MQGAAGVVLNAPAPPSTVYDVARITSTPIRASRIPVTMMPKLATAMPLLAVVTAVIGAMKPKDEPK